MSYLINAGTLKDDDYKKEEIYLLKKDKTYKPRESLLTRLRTKRVFVIIGRGGSRRRNAVMAPTGRPDITLVLAIWI
jgi:hypothetical protein